MKTKDLQNEIISLKTENEFLKAVIKKYVEHVDFSEGADFLSDYYLKWDEVKFTEKEIEYLKSI